MDTILLGIDGTGPLTDKSYYQQMHTSFVRFIVGQSGARAKRYERGPAADGFDMAAIVAKGYEFVHLNLVPRPKAAVLLAGYSRGGAGVIAIAARLAKDKVNVRSLVLFDAVDRAVGIDASDISRNVEHVVYARRDPNAFTRRTFGNCGTRWHAPTKCEMHYFRGTHGALGGCPSPVPPGASRSDFISEGFPEASPTLITYEQDARAAHEVWTWVSARLRRYGYSSAPAIAGNYV
jgi:hypothetical protein